MAEQNLSEEENNDVFEEVFGTDKEAAIAKEKTLRLKAEKDAKEKEKSEKALLKKQKARETGEKEEEATRRGHGRRPEVI